MANTQTVIITAIDPALTLLPARMDSARGRVQMVAIGLQESRLVHRQQIGGPARGLWQFEQGGGVAGVLRHAATAAHAVTLCAARGVQAVARDVYNQLEHDDVLAAGFARLLLWSDPGPLPAIGDSQGAWQLYLRTWRPGKPHRRTWDALYAEAVEACSEHAA
jgi:hypothetical protein